MARRRRKRRLELEAEYWRLLAAGVGSVEACRRVGIGRKTGYRRREENGGPQPDCLPEISRSGRYLSLLERRRIASMRSRGLAIREMAGLLGRTPSTVSRELRRNSRPHDYGRYDADLAHHRGRERAGRPRRSKLSTDPELKAEIEDKLTLEWSPEQIAAQVTKGPVTRPATSGRDRVSLQLGCGNEVTRSVTSCVPRAVGRCPAWAGRSDSGAVRRAPTVRAYRTRLGLPCPDHACGRPCHSCASSGCPFPQTLFAWYAPTRGQQIAISGCTNAAIEGTCRHGRLHREGLCRTAELRKRYQWVGRQKEPSGRAARSPRLSALTGSGTN
ncbi:transposase [Streptomyces sp. NPDC001083]|uniref:transposase n=1 Tax=Streptomyces sp. NPDC001083 TaxID=3364545 RepID=UPI0036C25611